MDSISASGPGRFALVGAVAGTLVATLLLGGIAGLFMGAPFTRTWLAVLFAINSGFAGASLATLHHVTPLDITVLVLGSVTFAGFWPGPGRPRPLWMGLAIGLPLAGVGVLLATGFAGRSGLMGGGLVLAVLMLLDRALRPLGYVGVAANALLLLGDFGTVGSRSGAIAAAVGIGLVLMVVWFALMAFRLALARTSPLGSPQV